MSTKTLRKRIALVAVAALGAGVLSVAPANAANEGQIGTDPAVGSVGVLAEALVAAAATGTATVLTTGKVGITSTGGAGAYFVVSSGAYVAGGIVDATDTTPDGTVSGDQKKYTSAAADNIFYVVPTGAAGTSFTITGYATSTSTTVVSKQTVTIAASSVAGVVSPADSTLSWVSDDGEAADADETGESSTTYGTGLFLSIKLKDAYEAAITSTSGALVVSVSSGATVKLAGTAGNAVGSAGTFNTAVSALNPSDINAYIAESTVGAGWNGTVTVTYNGVTIGTKSGKITGAPASITVTPKKIGTTAGGANEDSFTFLVKDAAGNNLDFTASAYVLNKSSDLAIVSDAVGTEDGSAATATPANGDHTCAGTAGSADVSLKTTINGTVLVSNTVKLTCGGAAVAYSASFDKASYIQGEIATLTATFKDAAGNLAHSYSTVTTADGDTTISAPMMVRVGGDTILAATKPGLSGTIAHTFTVGTNSGLTEGSYNAVVNYSKTLTLAPVSTVAYKVTTGGTGVSNADVLKAIVSLIASINKQIAALQKALLKR
jgi:trimeric autotransporter adhesin